jgi:hypothetical protein
MKVGVFLKFNMTGNVYVQIRLPMTIGWASLNSQTFKIIRVLFYVTSKPERKTLDERR